MKLNTKLFVVRIDCGQGWVGYYQQTTLENITRFVINRGVQSITIKDNETQKYIDYTLKEFRNKFLNYGK